MTAQPATDPQYCEDCRHCRPAREFLYWFNRKRRMEYAKCLASPRQPPEVLMPYLAKNLDRKPEKTRFFLYCDTVRIYNNPDPAHCPKYEAEG